MKEKMSTRKKIIILFILVFVMSAGTVFVMAKYYATTNNKGVAVASGLYFNSNILINEAGTIDIGEIVTQYNNSLIDIPISINSKEWSSSTYTFPIEIRNYNSILLYNDSNLNIKYNIEIVQLNSVAGTSYSVKRLNENGIYEEETLTRGVVKKYEEVLQGGEALFNKFDINMNIEDNSGFTGRSAKILVLAYPVSPDYIAVSAENLRLISILQGDYTQSEISIDKQGFVIENGMDNTNFRSIIDTYSGYEYNITTYGDMAIKEGDSINQMMKITWNNSMLTIDQFSSYFIEARDNSNVIDNGDGTTSILIEAMPYANISIVFYKKKNADFSTISSKKAFTNLVKAEILEN